VGARSLFLVGAVALLALAFLGIQIRFFSTRAVQPVSHDTKMEVALSILRRFLRRLRWNCPVKPWRILMHLSSLRPVDMKAWYFDIGAKVKAGGVLAEIDTPEVDQELAQAQAQLKVAQSALNLSQATFQRMQNL